MRNVGLLLTACVALIVVQRAVMWLVRRQGAQYDPAIDGLIRPPRTRYDSFDPTLSVRAAERRQAADRARRAAYRLDTEVQP